MEVDTDENMGAGANLDNSDESQTAYLPLMDSEGKLLPLHFLVGAEVSMYTFHMSRRFTWHCLVIILQFICTLIFSEGM